jgi:hypothetical protein
MTVPYLKLENLRIANLLKKLRKRRRRLKSRMEMMISLQMPHLQEGHKIQ